MNTNNLPETVKQKLYIHLTNNDRLSVDSCDMTSVGWALLGMEEVTLKVPQVDVVSVQLSALEKAKSEVVREYETKLHQIDERIQNLRALSYSAA